METEHEFTLALDGISDLTREVVDALYEAGCDDGTIVMRASRVSIGFTRSAPTLSEAIVSAITDVRRAGIGARVVRVDEASPSTENAQQAVGAINGVLQASFAMELDPTLRPLVFRVLEYAR